LPAELAELTYEERANLRLNNLCPKMNGLSGGIPGLPTPRYAF
jgi:hypothetical protein